MNQIRAKVGHCQVRQAAGDAAKTRANGLDRELEKEPGYGGAACEGRQIEGAGNYDRETLFAVYRYSDDRGIGPARL